MKAGSRIAVIGSRKFRYLHLVSDFVKTIPKDLVLVSGGSWGVDRMAENTAIEIGLQHKIYQAEWKKYGKKAGVFRNELLLENSDAVVAFWDEQSKGAGYTIRRAKDMKLPLRVFNGSKNAEWRDDLFVS